MEDNMKKLFCVFFSVGLAVLFLTGVSFSQSGETGAIEGKITDEELNVLPGAEIKLASPNMIGGARSKIADEYGKFRFVGLQPGTYSIEATLPGFAREKREGIRLFAGQTLTVDFALKLGKLEEKVTVVAESPLVDVKDSSVVTTNIDTETLQTVIFDSIGREDYAFGVVNYAPGTMTTEAYGSRVRVDNVYQIDGVDTSYQADGADWAMPDIYVFEEANITGLGAPAEYDGFTGVSLNMITKSGGNTFDGMAQFLFNNFNWVASNIDADDPKYSLYTEPPKQRHFNIHFSLGGPIVQDKLWFFAAGRHVRSETELEGQSEREIFKGPKFFIKLTYQLAESTRVQAFAAHDYFWYENRNLSVVRPLEATTVEDYPGYYYNLSGLHIFSDKTYLEIKLGVALAPGEYRGRNGEDVPARYDALTGMYSGNSKHFIDSEGSRFQVNTSLSHHADEFLAGSHDFKFGVEYENIGEENLYKYNGRYFYVDNAFGYAGYTYAYEFSYGWDTKGYRVSFFAQDAWTLTDNITINPGIRYNLYRGSLKSSNEKFVTDAWAPRIGLTWDIFGDHKTALKIHYGKFNDKLTTNKWVGASPTYDDYVIYRVLPDNSKLEIFRMNFSNPATIDPDIKMPSIDQFTIGVQREVAKDVSLGLTFVWKRWKNFIFNINRGSTYDPVIFPYTDENGNPQTGQAYNRTSSPDQDEFYITNPDADLYSSVAQEPEKKYVGLIFEFEKRFSNNWMLNASYTYYKTTANNWLAGWNTYPSSNPNASVNSLAGYPEHNIKVFGTFILPLKIRLSPFFQFRSGFRWTRSIQAPVAGNPYVFVETRGTQKLSNLIGIDLKIEKDFTIQNDFRVGIFTDIYNLLNRAEEWAVIQSISSQNLGKAVSVTQGRLFRIGLRLYF
jgi:hypothetical protein